MKKLTSTLLLLLISTQIYAEQMYKRGPWDIHYIAFPSTFIQPTTAKAIGVKRRNNSALVNISVIKRSNKKANKAKVSGVARNLLGHIKELEFIEVDEGDAIYYIAEVKHRNEETLIFKIDALIEGKSYQIEFKNKLYVD